MYAARGFLEGWQDVVAARLKHFAFRKLSLVDALDVARAPALKSLSIAK